MGVIIDGYVIHGTYRKVFAGLGQHYAGKDQELHVLVQRLQDVTQNDLGIREEIRCPVTTSIKEFRKMEKYTTPVEKLICLDTTIKEIAHAVTTRRYSTTKHGK